ncbi:TPA: tail fiber assembly protein [Escherichia coli]
MRLTYKNFRFPNRPQSVIQLLERAVRLNMATDEERTRLEAWERYSVLVSRVDTAKPVWPQKPE